MKINDIARKMADDYYLPNCTPNNDGRWRERVNHYEKGIREGLRIAILIAEQRGGAYHFVDKVNDVLDGKREIPVEVSGGE